MPKTQTGPKKKRIDTCDQCVFYKLTIDSGHLGFKNHVCNHPDHHGKVFWQRKLEIFQGHVLTPKHCPELP
jgi:hypothetical protein